MQPACPQRAPLYEGQALHARPAAHTVGSWVEHCQKPFLAGAGVVRDALGGPGGSEEHVRMRCALMRLSLPVELLAAQLLRLPLHALADGDGAAP